MRVLLLDNYDSFTYNLEHYLTALGSEVVVRRNDEELGDVSSYDALVLSPGPGMPSEAGTLMEYIRVADGIIPILGVCLGMQGMAEYLGGELYNQQRVKHGVQETIFLNESPLFGGVDKEIQVGLYHSWAVQADSGDFELVARSGSGVVMAIQNEDRMMYGVQFHPESIMTPDGRVILENFLNICRR